MAHVQDDNINIKAKLQQSKSIKCGVNNNSAINASLQNYNAIGSNVVERGLQGIPGKLQLFNQEQLQQAHRVQMLL